LAVTILSADIIYIIVIMRRVWSVTVWVMQRLLKAWHARYRLQSPSTA